ncbi:MAG: hypothetical protein WKG07_38315 [Hymenobacter sp.]
MGAYAEHLLLDMSLLEAAQHRGRRANPLGSGAGFGWQLRHRPGADDAGVGF